MPELEAILQKIKSKDIDVKQQNRLNDVQTALALSHERESYIRTLARCIFYVTHHRFANKNLTANMMEQTINDGPRYFLGREKFVDHFNISNFSRRVSNRPKDIEAYFEYVRFCALLMQHSPALANDNFLRETLKEGDFFNIYKLARDNGMEAVNALMTKQRKSQGPIFDKHVYVRLNSLLKFRRDEGFLRDVLLGQSPASSFYSYRYTSMPGLVSCARVDIRAPVNEHAFFTFTTHTKVRVEGQAALREEEVSEGVVFCIGRVIYMIGRLNRIKGLNFVAIPVFSEEALSNRLSGLLVTPDTTGRREPVASRIEMVRAAAGFDDTKVGVHGEAQVDPEVVARIRNNIKHELEGRITAFGITIQDYNQLDVTIDQHMSGFLNWPIVSIDNDLAKPCNPIDLIKPNCGLISAG